MASTDSPIPFIKDEPDDYHQIDPNHYMPNVNGSYQNPTQWDNNHVDPHDLNMTGNMLHRTYGSSQNLSSSYIAGTSGIADDELYDLVNLNSGAQQPHPNHTFQDPSMSDLQYSAVHPPHNSYGGVYSNTPDGAPIQSPFVHGFNYNQWQSVHPPRQSFGQGIGQMQRPAFRQMESQGSAPRSPMSPMTPGSGMGNLKLSSPDSSSFQGQHIQGNNGHFKSVSSQWGSLGSGQSYLDSPLASPSTQTHPQISEVLKSGKHASLPTATKVEPGSHGRASTSIDERKQKRRQSHNAVERRRRNNINDRIAELARLVPPHRLEDDAIRRHSQNNAALPSSLTAEGLSPPQTSAGLPGSGGRRAAGTITQGLPSEEKDKSPAKGDVLNGAVGWTRDLMWLLNNVLEREQLLIEKITDMGGDVPVSVGEDEERMRSELIPALTKNAAKDFRYTRRHHSGLWVPGHTDYSGDRLGDSGASMSPGGFNSNAHGSGSGNDGTNAEGQFWGYNNDQDHERDSLDFKEEDELAMDIG